MTLTMPLAAEAAVASVGGGGGGATTRSFSSSPPRRPLASSSTSVAAMPSASAAASMQPHHRGTYRRIQSSHSLYNRSSAGSSNPSAPTTANLNYTFSAKQLERLNQSAAARGQHRRQKLLNLMQSRNSLQTVGSDASGGATGGSGGGSGADGVVSDALQGSEEEEDGLQLSQGGTSDRPMISRNSSHGSSHNRGSGEEHQIASAAASVAAPSRSVATMSPSNRASSWPTQLGRVVITTPPPLHPVPSRQTAPRYGMVSGDDGNSHLKRPSSSTMTSLSSTSSTGSSSSNATSTSYSRRRIFPVVSSLRPADDDDADVKVGVAPPLSHHRRRRHRRSKYDDFDDDEDDIYYEAHDDDTKDDEKLPRSNQENVGQSANVDEANEQDAGEPSYRPSLPVLSTPSEEDEDDAETDAEKDTAKSLSPTLASARTATASTVLVSQPDILDAVEKDETMKSEAREASPVAAGVEDGCGTQGQTEPEQDVRESKAENQVSASASASARSGGIASVGGEDTDDASSVASALAISMSKRNLYDQPDIRSRSESTGTVSTSVPASGTLAAPPSPPRGWWAGARSSFVLDTKLAEKMLEDVTVVLEADEEGEDEESGHQSDGRTKASEQDTTEEVGCDDIDGEDSREGEASKQVQDHKEGINKARGGEEASFRTRPTNASQLSRNEPLHKTITTQDDTPKVDTEQGEGRETEKGRRQSTPKEEVRNEEDRDDESKTREKDGERFEDRDNKKDEMETSEDEVNALIRALRRKEEEFGLQRRRSLTSHSDGNDQSEGDGRVEETSRKDDAGDGSDMESVEDIVEEDEAIRPRTDTNDDEEGPAISTPAGPTRDLSRRLSARRAGRPVTRRLSSSSTNASRPRTQSRASAPGAIQMSGRAFGQRPSWDVEMRRRSEGDFDPDADDDCASDGDDTGDIEAPLNLHEADVASNRSNRTGRMLHNAEVPIEATPVLETDPQSADVPFIYAKAESMPSTAKLLLRDRPFTLCCAAIIVGCVGAVLAVAITLTVPKRSSQFLSPSNSRSPSPAPTISMSPTKDLSQYWESLEGHSDPAALRTAGTPQNRALNWLAYDDTIRIDKRGPALLQRYAALVLYFATEGETAWLVRDRWLDPLAHECAWGRGIKCSQRGAMKVIDHIDLSRNGLEGSLPREIGLFRDLESLNLNGNNLPGPIPTEIGLLTSLAALELENNLLTGSLPPSIGNLRSLDDLDVSNNRLSGFLPDGLFSLRELRTLDLSFNDFSGTVSDDAFNLEFLSTCDLSSNHFNGTFPIGLAGIENLAFLRVDNNQFSGPIVDVMKFVPLREEFTAANNWLSGSLPNVDLDYETLLRIFPNFRLKKIDISGNKLNGNIGDMLRILKPLRHVDLSGNQFTGRINHQNLSSPILEFLDLSENFFTGELPSSFEAPRLKFVDIHSNLISGRLDTSWELISQLEYGDCSYNNFEGELSTRFLALSNLEFFSAEQNNLSGPLPTFLGGLSNLQFLDFNTNQFSGQLTDGYSNLDFLDELHLRNNRLTGTIPSSVSLLQNLRILSLSGNRFRGTIPSELGDVRSLGELHLDGNQLSGTIPSWIGTLSGLRLLSLKSNRLVGSIPSSFGDLNSLEKLYLEENSLVGTVPIEVCDLRQGGSLTVFHVDVDRVGCECCTASMTANRQKLRSQLFTPRHPRRLNVE